MQIAERVFRKPSWSIKTSTIADACDLATAQSRVPMKLLTQQVPTDIQLEF